MSHAQKKAVLYRMKTDEHQCPYGRKTKYFLEREGYAVDDHTLKNREQIDAFKQKHDVETTPQVFIDDERIGGYEETREYLGKPLADPDSTSYQPVIALFSMTALTSVALTWLVFDTLVNGQTLMWFISLSMVVLALLKLQDLESFSTMFLNYDLLAKRWVPYGYIYPFAEGLAGVLMVGQVATWLSAPLALFIGGIGAVSVFKAVYIDKRELKCACVGGASNVPLGFISLTENLMMIAMAIWMAIPM
ncbi:glutaredoxin family protein [Lacimicrobium sp. SS2-24]|uniref:glutaredoxin family protein n=1 Tax=Lacimicrobium sp. SS2-24 TaxID=2005569 RepID=UPI000B4B9140|nr:glutaredoxin family protein [Lacimicrobium sp. SS2-24]